MTNLVVTALVYSLSSSDSVVDRIEAAECDEDTDDFDFDEDAADDDARELDLYEFEEDVSDSSEPSGVLSSSL